MQTWGPEEAQVGKGKRGALPFPLLGQVYQIPAEASPPIFRGRDRAVAPSQPWVQSQPSSSLAGFITLGVSPS